jgi:hypothetical protein
MALTQADRALPRLDRTQRRFASRAQAEQVLGRPVFDKNGTFEQPRFEQGTPQWLVERWNGANSSDALVIPDGDKYPFKKRWQWFAEKAGPPPDLSAPDPLANNRHVRRGKFYEDVAAAKYERMTNNCIIDFGVLRHHELYEMRPADFTPEQWHAAITQQMTPEIARDFVLAMWESRVPMLQPVMDTTARLLLGTFAELWERRCEYVDHNFLRVLWQYMRPATETVDETLWARVYSLNWFLGSVDGVTTQGNQTEFKVPNKCHPGHIRAEYELQIQINNELLGLDQPTHYMQFDALREELHLLERPVNRNLFLQWREQAEPVWRDVLVARITGVIPPKYQQPPPRQNKRSLFDDSAMPVDGIVLDARDEAERALDDDNNDEAFPVQVVIEFGD